MTKLEDIPKICICHNLRKTSRAITQFYDMMLEPSGLALTQFSLLVGISISKSSEITKLASEMMIDRTTLTRNLSILQRQGLVRIAGSGNDKRTKNIVITSKGKELLAKALPLWEKAQSTLMEKFGKANCNNILLDLSKIGKFTAHH